MRIVDLKHPEREFTLTGSCGLCLGFFDGVHLGHRALVDTLRAENDKREVPLPLGALCFTEPPKNYFSSVKIPQLTPLAEKLDKLRRAGLRFAVLYDFPEIMELDAFDFVKDILIKTLDCRLLVCGYNYTFGKGAAGTPETLAVYFATQPGRTLRVVPEVKLEGRTVSSTTIRELLLNGEPATAARLLGEAYSITGRVRDGLHIGRTIDTPTANLFFEDDYLVPRRGVYITTTRVGNRTFPGISNVGVRPTVPDSDGRVNCETFLFGFHGDLYNKTVTVSFVRFLRPEMKYDSLDALRAQIAKDVKEAKAYFHCD